MRVLRLLIPLFLLLLTAVPAHADFDFDAGMAAYERGDFKQAMTEWLPLAEAGDAEAQYRVGRLYGFGEGVELDYVAAARWYHNAANQGHIIASYNLGHSYWNGTGVAKHDKLAAKWFRAAADKGDAPAQYYMGIAYSNGQGVKESQELAVHWLERAAKQGDTDAQGALAFHYLAGIGVEVDRITSYMWLLLVLERTERVQHYLLAPYFWIKCTSEERASATKRARSWRPKIETAN